MLHEYLIHLALYVTVVTNSAKGPCTQAHTENSGKSYVQYVYKKRVFTCLPWFDVQVNKRISKQIYTNNDLSAFHRMQVG